MIINVNKIFNNLDWKLFVIIFTHVNTEVEISRLNIISKRYSFSKDNLYKIKGTTGPATKLFPRFSIKFQLV